MQEAIEISTELMDKKIRTFAERETASKRKFENTSRTTRNQQQQHSNKRQNTGRVYTAASGGKKQYGGSRPLCAKCNYHHDSPCTPKCHNYNKIGHSACDCRSVANTNNANNQKGTGSGQKLGCYECRVQGHFRRECPKLKNSNNHGNQGGRNNAPARVYAVGRAGTDPDANVVMGTLLLNNRYASILFDTGADRSFVSTTFSTQINITLSTLDHCYDVELADKRIIRDRRAHAYTRHLMETEARMSREAWVRATDSSDLIHGEKQMAPKQTTRSTVDQETINATSVTNAQLQAMIDQGVTAALAARDALSTTYGMSWKMLMKVMTEKYYPRNEIRKLEMELWDLKIEKYVGGLPDMIHGSVVASKPKTMQEAIEIATELMDKKIRTFAERETASKRKFENTSRNTRNQQQHSNKWQNTGRVYTAASGEKKQYGGSKPLCAKCNYHHDGPCAPKCRNCNKIGHFARDCRSTANTNNANNQRGTGLGQRHACYECGVQEQFKRECPKLKNNNNHGNQGGRNNASAWVYAVGRAGTDPDANVVTGMFLLNNRYASILFDTGADRSFVSTRFSTQINIAPSTLDHCYDVELANGRIIELNTILRGCTLNLLNHPFNIDLMPVELDSFDAIIGMDWLAKYQAVIVCAEKIVRIL
nr:hypothetical protein [Tanacetum cinerariifolium]